MSLNTTAAAAVAAASALREDVRKRRNPRGVVEGLRVLSEYPAYAGMIEPVLEAMSSFKPHKTDGEENKVIRSAYEYIYGAAGAGELTQRQAASVCLQLVRADTRDDTLVTRRACAQQLLAWLLAYGCARELLPDVCRRLDSDLAKAVRSSAHRGGPAVRSTALLGMFSSMTAAQKTAAEQAYAMPALLSAVEWAVSAVLGGGGSRADAAGDADVSSTLETLVEIAAMTVGDVAVGAMRGVHRAIGDINANAATPTAPALRAVVLHYLGYTPPSVSSASRRSSAAGTRPLPTSPAVDPDAASATLAVHKDENTCVMHLKTLGALSRSTIAIDAICQGLLPPVDFQQMSDTLVSRKRSISTWPRPSIMSPLLAALSDTRLRVQLAAAEGIARCAFHHAGTPFDTSAVLCRAAVALRSAMDRALQLPGVCVAVTAIVRVACELACACAFAVASTGCLHTAVGRMRPAVQVTARITCAARRELLHCQMVLGDLAHTVLCLVIARKLSLHHHAVTIARKLLAWTVPYEWLHSSLPTCIGTGSAQNIVWCQRASIALEALMLIMNGGMLPESMLLWLNHRASLTGTKAAASSTVWKLDRVAGFRRANLLVTSALDAVLTPSISSKDGTVDLQTIACVGLCILQGAQRAAGYWTGVNMMYPATMRLRMRHAWTSAVGAAAATYTIPNAGELRIPALEAADDGNLAALVQQLRDRAVAISAAIDATSKRPSRVRAALYGPGTARFDPLQFQLGLVQTTRASAATRLDEEPVLKHVAARAVLPYTLPPRVLSKAASRVCKAIAAAALEDGKALAETSPSDEQVYLARRERMLLGAWAGSVSA